MKIARLTILLLLIPHLLFADVIVRIDGTKVRGTIANREHVAQNRLNINYLAILSVDSDELLRIAVAEISYVILENNGDRIVVEFGPATDRTDTPKRQPRKDLSLKGSGIVLMIMGGGALVTGGLVKLGERDVGEKKTFTELNYALMVGGAILLIVGGAMASADRSNDRSNAKLFIGERIAGVAVRF
jgi:hypothetical protein